MREALNKMINERKTFMGVFIKFGIKNGWRHKEPTVLLEDIRDMKGNLLTDHLWFNYTNEFKRLWKDERLHSFDIIQFSARIKGYWKGYKKDEFDCKLSNPSKLKIIADYSWYCNAKNCDPPFRYIKDFFFYTHHYYKFDNSEYTTIRDLGSLEYYELNQKIEAKLQEEILHSAIIFKIETRKISSLPLELLKKDCEYKGFKINSKSEFIDLINSLRHNKKSHVKLENDPEFAIYYFHKIMKEKTLKKKYFWTDTATTCKKPSLDRFLKGVKK